MKKACFYSQQWLRESIHRFRLQEAKMGTTDQEEKLLALLHWAVTDIIIASKGTNYATVTQLLHTNLFGFFNWLYIEDSVGSYINVSIHDNEFYLHNGRMPRWSIQECLGQFG